MIWVIFLGFCILSSVEGRRSHKGHKHLFKKNHIPSSKRSLVFDIPVHHQSKDGCLHKGVIRKHGEVWSPGACIPECHCINGKVTCTKLECPDLNCERSIKRKWKCCPECPPKAQRDDDTCGVRTIGGNANKTCCHFPYKYNDVMLYTCTYQDSKTPWCSVTANYDRDGVWGICVDEKKKKKHYRIVNGKIESYNPFTKTDQKQVSNKVVPKLLPSLSAQNDYITPQIPIPYVDNAKWVPYQRMQDNQHPTPTPAAIAIAHSMWRNLGYKPRQYGLLSHAGGQTITVALDNGGLLPTSVNAQTATPVAKVGPGGINTQPGQAGQVVTQGGQQVIGGALGHLPAINKGNYPGRVDRIIYRSIARALNPSRGLNYNVGSASVGGSSGQTLPNKPAPTSPPTQGGGQGVGSGGQGGGSGGQGGGSGGQGGGNGGESGGQGGGNGTQGGGNGGQAGGNNSTSTILLDQGSNQSPTYNIAGSSQTQQYQSNLQGQQSSNTPSNVPLLDNRVIPSKEQTYSAGAPVTNMAKQPQGWWSNQAASTPNILSQPSGVTNYALDNKTSGSNIKSFEGGASDSLGSPQNLTQPPQATPNPFVWPNMTGPPIKPTAAPKQVVGNNNTNQGQSQVPVVANVNLVGIDVSLRGPTGSNGASAPGNNTTSDVSPQETKAQSANPQQGNSTVSPQSNQVSQQQGNADTPSIPPLGETNTSQSNVAPVQQTNQSVPQPSPATGSSWPSKEAPPSDTSSQVLVNSTATAQTPTNAPANQVNGTAAALASPTSGTPQPATGTAPTSNDTLSQDSNLTSSDPTQAGAPPSPAPGNGSYQVTASPPTSDVESQSPNYATPSENPSPNYATSENPAPNYATTSENPAPNYATPSENPAPNYATPSENPAPNYGTPSASPAPSDSPSQAQSVASPAPNENPPPAYATPTSSSNSSDQAVATNYTNDQPSPNSLPTNCDQQDDQGKKCEESEDDKGKAAKEEEEESQAHLYEYMVAQPPSGATPSDPYEAQRRAALQARETAEAYNRYLKNFYAKLGYGG